jgi:hypothetical protein
MRGSEAGEYQKKVGGRIWEACFFPAVPRDAHHLDGLVHEQGGGRDNRTRNLEQRKDGELTRANNFESPPP